MTKIVTKLEQCKKNKDRVNVHTEEGFLMALYIKTVVDFNLKVGTALLESQIEELLSEDEGQYAMTLSMNLISYKMRTRRELEIYLERKGIESGNATKTLDTLEGYGYLDDAKYARLYAKELSLKYGRRVIEQRLRVKGIESELIREILEEIQNEEESVNKERELLQSQAERLYNRYINDDAYKRRGKMMRNLMSHGFDLSDIKSVIERVEEERD